MKLSPEDVTAQLATCPGWAVAGAAIRKLYTLKSFPDAIAFVTRLAFDAEAADHHPDLHVSYRKVTVVWSTHSEGGLTAKDFDGARSTDRIAATCWARRVMAWRGGADTSDNQVRFPPRRGGSRSRTGDAHVVDWGGRGGVRAGRAGRARAIVRSI